MAEIDTDMPEHTTVTFFADKEEIGSEGNTGLNSDFLLHYLEDLAEQAGVNIRTPVSYTHLLKNPYYMLLGTGIGLLDALPLFGTGTALIPWAIIELIAGKSGQAAALTGIYGICYVLRQVLETRMMAKGTGLSALETLAALYIGLRLFGIWGVLLGPAALMLIKTFLEIIADPAEKI